ncbi:MAG: CHRD domain-containing protein [Ferruginibacter sp.]
MKMKIAFMATGILLLLLWSCKKDKTDPVNNSSNFAATMSGASENPANSSVATGSATGTYDSVSKVLTLTISYSGITPTAGHIHKGAVGSNGPVTFPFSSVASSPISFSTTLTAAQQTDLFASLYYVNLHTAAFPGGEIRGQLLKQ